MTKAELVARVAKRERVSRAKSGAVIEAAFQEVQELLKRGDSIAFTGFGSFSVGRRAKRRGYNPQTGREMTIPAQKVARFRAGKALRAAIGGKAR